MIQEIKMWLYRLMALGLLAGPLVARAQYQDPPDFPETNLPVSSITDIVIGLMLALLFIVGFLAIIAFVIAGIWYLTSAGDESRMEMGKKAMLSAVIGVVVSMIGLVVISAIQNVLRGEGGPF